LLERHRGHIDSIELARLGEAVRGSEDTLDHLDQYRTYANA
jgi:hypothetical protein